MLIHVRISNQFSVVVYVAMRCLLSSHTNNNSNNRWTEAGFPDFGVTL